MSVIVIVGTTNVFVKHGVLVTGRGNSGMEIAHDFATHGATMIISVRSPVNIVNKELIYLGIMAKLKFLRTEFADQIIGFLAWFKFVDLSNYGFVRPNLGTSTDGAVEKIRDGVIKVQPSMSNSVGSQVNFSIGQHFTLKLE
ncbi:putative indole-3-pyruvate monooxygenase YUCCA10 [Carex rostrata]